MLLMRDRMPADESYCICYCHGSAGGTAYTVRYAISKGILTFNCSPWNLEQLHESRQVIFIQGRKVGADDP